MKAQERARFAEAKQRLEEDEKAAQERARVAEQKAREAEEKLAQIQQENAAIKAQAQTPSNSTVQPTSSSKPTHEVFNTYKDPNGETWLTMRDKPQVRGSSKIGKLVDGTKLLIKGYEGSKNRWAKVKVLSGPHNGTSGFVSKKWTRPIRP
jgi:hypothetical protein